MKILSLLALFALLSCQNPETDAPKAKRFKTILISAEGSIDVKPNMASFSVSILSERKTIAASRQNLADQQKILMDILKEFGIEDNDIQTGYISLRKHNSWLNGSNVFIGYKSRIETEINLNDLSIIDKLYSRIFEMDGLDPSGLNFSHNNLDSLAEVAYQRALESANSTTEKLLQKMKENEMEIIRVGNSGLSSKSEAAIMGLPGEIARRDYSYKEYKENNGIEISKGMIEISRSLTVEYKIK